jgi:hypothetical protein
VVYLLKESVVDAIRGVGFPPLRGPVDKIVCRAAPIYV